MQKPWFEIPHQLHYYYYYYDYYYLTYILLSRFMHTSPFILSNQQNTIKAKCYITQVVDYLSMQVVTEHSLLAVKISQNSCISFQNTRRKNRIFCKSCFTPFLPKSLLGRAGLRYTTAPLFILEMPTTDPVSCE